MMKVVEIYNHLLALDYLQNRKPNLWLEILEVIDGVDAEKAKTKISAEKTMTGKRLYSPKEMNKLFGIGFGSRQWKELRINYCVTNDLHTTKQIAQERERIKQKQTIIANGFTPFDTYNQVDFVKDRVAVEVQFGKYFAVQYDLHVKHTMLFQRDDIDIGVEIIPTHKLMSEMSSGVPWYENELTNIIREGRSNPSVPIILIGVEP